MVGRLAVPNKGNNIVNNSTIELLRVIGSPFSIKENSDLEKAKISELYKHSIKNRLPLFFLDCLDKKNKLFEFDKTYQMQYSRYIKIFDAMARVSEYLIAQDIEHAIFKSLKPFPDASVDVDTIIFDSQKYNSLVKDFSRNGWKLLGYGPQSATFFDSEAEVGIDLYREIAVSWVSYLDKDKLRNHVTRKILPNEKGVFTLQVEADLLSTIAHSIIKEQLYTLAEFYTIMIWLKSMEKIQVNNFLNLIEKNKMFHPVKTFVTITYLLHKKAFNFVPTKMVNLLKHLGLNVYEQRKLINNNFQTPHKYHTFSFTKSLINKLKEEKTRRSFAIQGFKMINPYMTKEVILGVIDHTMRLTY